MSEHETVVLAADVVLLSPTDHGWRVLVIQRAKEPFKGMWALPGGRVEVGETFRQAAVREMREETGIDLGHRLRPVPVGYYDDPERDSRYRVVSLAFMAVVSNTPEITLTGDDGVSDADWALVDNLIADPTSLAFDHWSMVYDAAGKLRESGM